MRHVFTIVSVLSILALPTSGWADEGADTGSAPLLLASDAGPKIEFQIGADVMGGDWLGDIDFVGGVNATFVYRVIDLVWVGIRPSLHYMFMSDSPYDMTWMHADAAVQINFFHDPVRVYGLVAGGYAFALDNDIDEGLAHGWSSMAGVGVAWRPDEEVPVGLFCELGFRYGSATRETTRLVLTEDGRPIYIEEDLVYETETYDRTFEILTMTFNIGLTVSP